MILLRDLPGVGTLDWALEQWTPKRAALGGRDYDADEDLHEFGLDVAEHYFGICDDDIDLDDSHFPQLRMFRDEADEYWRSHGWDVTDGEGRQLRAMQYLLRPMVCMVEKLHPGAKFSGGEAELATWTAQLEEAAKRFKPSR